jgi:hypothetical protein
MPAIKGHFDGTGVVLDEPASLQVGQPVRVIAEPLGDDLPRSRPGPATGTFESSFSPHADATGALMNGDALDEREAVHVDPLDRVPPDFIRKPGSGAGEIKMTADFETTPNDFEEYL